MTVSKQSVFQICAPTTDYMFTIFSCDSREIKEDKPHTSNVTLNFVTQRAAWPLCQAPSDRQTQLCFDQELQHCWLLYMSRCNNLSLFSSL